MEPQTIQNLISTTMYEKRFGPWFTEPVVAGLDKVSGYSLKIRCFSVTFKNISKFLCKNLVPCLFTLQQIQSLKLNRTTTQ